jgi:hypothetical protein
MTILDGIQIVLHIFPAVGPTPTPNRDKVREDKTILQSIKLTSKPILQTTNTDNGYIRISVA